MLSAISIDDENGGTRSFVVEAKFVRNIPDSRVWDSKVTRKLRDIPDRSSTLGDAWAACMLPKESAEIVATTPKNFVKPSSPLLSWASNCNARRQDIDTGAKPVVTVRRRTKMVCLTMNTMIEESQRRQFFRKRSGFSIVDRMMRCLDWWATLNVSSTWKVESKVKNLYCLVKTSWHPKSVWVVESTLLWYHTNSSTIHRNRSNGEFDLLKYHTYLKISNTNKSEKIRLWSRILKV